MVKGLTDDSQVASGLSDSVRNENSAIWGFVLVREFTPVLVTCKFDDDPIKNKVVTVSTTFYGKNFRRSRAYNSEADSLLWPEIVQDFMPVLVIYKFDEDPMKTEDAIVSTTFFPALKGS